MTIRELYEKLMCYPRAMRLNPPASEKQLRGFEEEFHTELPDQFRELLECFDGGEIFVPGTVIYGVGGQGSESLAAFNRGLARRDFSIPPQYLLFAELNFGDFLCIDLTGEHSVIQWDHETNEEYDEWESLSQWLEETIEDYAEYAGEE